MEEIVKESELGDIEMGKGILANTLAGTSSFPSSSATGHEEDPRVAILAGEIKKQLPGPTASPSQKPSIFKVPPHLRMAGGEDNEPKLVSIGPLHHGKDNLLPMEKVKYEYLQDLLNRDKRNSIENYVEEILIYLQQAREHYSENIVLPDDDELLKMLVVDGCFIIEIIAKSNCKEIQKTVLHAGRSWELLRLIHDLCLLENQIPFIVLTRLFEKTEIPLPDPVPRELLEVIDGKKPQLLVESIFRLLAVEVQPQMRPELLKASHLLRILHISLNPKFEDIPVHCCGSEAMFSFIFFGLFYIIFCCRSPNYKAVAKKMKTPTMIPCATELREAGITFKKKVFSRNPGYPHLKVSFRDGTLEIPVIIVDDATGYKLRNFIALEQCSEDFGNHFTSYCTFMDNIINTTSDVAILRETGILESMLGSDADVAHVFNGLCKDTCLDPDKHDNTELYKEVVAYCGFPHRKWRASLVHNYFSKPWAIFSVLAAFLLLVMTAAQTYYADKAFYKKNK